MFVYFVLATIVSPYMKGGSATELSCLIVFHWCYSDLNPYGFLRALTLRKSEEIIKF